MLPEDELQVQSVFAERLQALCTDGQITESIYLAAVDSPAVAHGVMIGYLESCWALSA